MITWEDDLYTDYIQPNKLADISNDVSFFMFNDKCYILDGTQYAVYDGVAVTPVTPYVPTLRISKDPASGGFANEDFNLIGSGFKDSFSGDGTSTDYFLTLQNLDDTPIIVTVDGVTKTLTTDYTWDKVTGKVSFVTAPTKGTNNVIITAYKTIPGMKERILKCRFHTLYGGSNDTRVFISGNPNMSDYVWRCGVGDPTYWPENGFYKLNETVKGFSKQYDYLLIERSNGKHVVTFEMQDDGSVSFPMKPINDKVGTLATNSIQIIENNPVSLTKDGVYMLVASNVRDERNVTHISQTIDRLLLGETGLSDAVSIDFDKKYWLALNGTVYVLDYTQKSDSNPYGEWYVYDNIHASSFIEMGGYLYFGSSKEGLIYRFHKETNNANSFNDDGEPIEAYWKSKALTFEAEEFLKYVESLFFSMKPSGKTSIELYYTTDQKEMVPISLKKPMKFNLFSFNNLDFSNFTFYFSQFPKEFKAKVKAKKITHFQLMVKNDKLNESLTLLSLGMNYRYQGKVRG